MKRQIVKTTVFQKHICFYKISNFLNIKIKLFNNKFNANDFYYYVNREIPHNLKHNTHLFRNTAKAIDKKRDITTSLTICPFL